MNNKKEELKLIQNKNNQKNGGIIMKQRINNKEIDTKEVEERIFCKYKNFQFLKDSEYFREILRGEINSCKDKLLSKISCNILDEDVKEVSKDDFKAIFVCIKDRYVQYESETLEKCFNKLNKHIEDNYSEEYAETVTCFRISTKAMFYNEFEEFEDDLLMIDNCEDYEEILNNEELFKRFKEIYYNYYFHLQESIKTILITLQSKLANDYPEDYVDKFEIIKTITNDAILELFAIEAVTLLLTEKYYSKINDFYKGKGE